MKLFRRHWLKRTATFMTGVIFLNMSFFLAEVKFLHLDKNRQMAENIAKLIAGAANEEEKDVAGGTSEDVKTGKEAFLDFSLRALVAPQILSSQYQHPHADGAAPVSGHQETFNPPPESRFHS